MSGYGCPDPPRPLTQGADLSNPHNFLPKNPKAANHTGCGTPAPLPVVREKLSRNLRLFKA